jgi:hypothetical protein
MKEKMLKADCEGRIGGASELLLSDPETTAVRLA